MEGIKQNIQRVMSEMSKLKQQEKSLGSLEKGIKDHEAKLEQLVKLAVNINFSKN